MSVTQALLIALAGMGAGTINTIVGSGTLITFPTLLLFGYPPVVANMSNNVGLVAAGFTAVTGYRREIAGTWGTLLRLVPFSVIGGATGALLLLVLDPGAFELIVPALILVGILLVLFGPRLNRLAAGLHHEDEQPAWHRGAMRAGITGAGVYGGYFGAAQGVILMGVMSILSSEPLQRLNGWKNLLGTVNNAVAALVFLAVAWGHIDWAVAGLIAAGAFVGGIVGSTVGRRLSPTALRVIITVVGTVALVKIVWFD